MRRSKYIGMTSGDWTCTFIGVDRVQPVYTKKRNENGKKIKSKRPGHRLYYYIFERLTSDQKADKLVRLTAAQILKVRKGLCTVEEIADKKKSKNSEKYTDRVCYSFCD